VNGSLGGTGFMTVASGATLGGIGTISKDATISGTLAPGNSIGTIHFVGAETLAAGSTLEIELNPAMTDLVDIVGTLTIDPGATLKILPDPGTYPVPFSYTIVQTTGGVSGTFSSVTSSLPLFQGAVVYTPLDVLLQVSFVPIPAIVAHGNAGKVAHCLNNLPAPAGSDLAFIVNAVRLLPSVSAIEDALIQMQPSAFTALGLSQEDATLYVSNAILNRLDLFSHSCNVKNNRGNHLWISALGGYTKQSNWQEEPGFETGTPGFVIGFDGTLAEQVCLGGSLSYTYMHLHWREDRGHADIQALYAALYGKWFGSIGYLEGSFMGAYDFYQTDRYIAFSSIRRHAHGSHGGQEGSFHLKGALTFDQKKTIISPFARLDFLYLFENSFRETGAKSLNLNVKAKKSDLLQTEAGIDISYCAGSASTSITPFLQVSAIRESRFTGRKERALLGGTCLMTVKGLNPSRTLGAASLGVNVAFSDMLSNISFLYRGRYGSHFQDHSLYLQVGMQF
jgi:outer membrane autotransporter protein